MKDLPPPAERRPIHTRRVTTQGFLREDGLWDIEGELVDTKTYPSAPSASQPRAPGEPIHHMRIRLTIDDRLVVRAAVAAMPNTPFTECQPAALPMDGLVGVSIGRGWRRAIEAAMGGVAGCTHLRELLSAMATVAFQTVGPYRQQERVAAGGAMYAGAEPAHQMGQCLGWDFDGPVVARVAPQFIGWRQPRKPAAPESAESSASPESSSAPPESSAT